MYLAAVALVLRLPDPTPPTAVGAVFAFAVAFRLIAAFHAPQLSDDIYRYVWDGRVQAAGVNPYLYAPDAPELAPLRDSLWEGVNHKAQRTPYPPLSEGAFALVFRLAPDSVRAMQVAMAAADLFVGAALVWLLTRLGLPSIRALIWLWSPAAVLHFGHSGHNDPLMLLPLVLAVAVVARPGAAASMAPAAPPAAARWRAWGSGRPPVPLRTAVAAAALVALAVLAKLVPLLYAPLWLRVWRVPGVLAFGAVVAAGYLPYLAAGPALLGGVVTEGGESIFNDGAFWVLRQFVKPFGVDPVGGAKLVVAALLVGLAAWTLVAPVRPRLADTVLDRTYLLTGAYVATAAVVEPWYAAWLLPFVAVRLRPGAWLGFAAGPALGWLLFSGLVEVSDFTYGNPDVPYLWTWVRLVEWVPLGFFAAWPLIRRGLSRRSRETAG